MTSRSQLKRWLWIALIWGGVSACASPGQDSLIAETEPRSYSLLIVNHGWHTGVVLPAREMRAFLPQLAERFPDAPYLEFGWGDEAFYRADKVYAGLALRALLWPTSSVMHVVAIPDEPGSYFPAQRREGICVTRKHYLALVGYIAASFWRSSSQASSSHGAGELASLGLGLYGDSQFYRAVGSYHLFNNCNTWLAKGLREAGMPISPGAMLTAQNLMLYLRELAEKGEMSETELGSACI